MKRSIIRATAVAGALVSIVSMVGLAHAHELAQPSLNLIVKHTQGSIRVRYANPTPTTVDLGNAFLASPAVRDQEGVLPGTLTTFTLTGDEGENVYAATVDLVGPEGHVRRLVGITSDPSGDFVTALLEAPPGYADGAADVSGTLRISDLTGENPVHEVTFQRGEVISMQAGKPVRRAYPSSIWGWLRNNILLQGVCQAGLSLANANGYRCPSGCTAWWNPWPTCLFCLVALCARSAG